MKIKINSIGLEDYFEEAKKHLGVAKLKSMDFFKGCCLRMYFLEDNQNLPHVNKNAYETEQEFWREAGIDFRIKPNVGNICIEAGEGESYRFLYSTGCIEKSRVVNLVNKIGDYLKKIGYEWKFDERSLLKQNESD